MSNVASSVDQTVAAPTVHQIYKVALASIVGSVIEQYDFLVTGVIAATVWPDIFFKEPGVKSAARRSPPTVSALSSVRLAPSFSATSPIATAARTRWFTLWC